MENKTEVITFRMGKELKEKMVKAYEKEQRNMSNWLFQLVYKELNKGETNVK